MTKRFDRSEMNAYAQAACAAIDSMDFPTIVGTLAGDDTIFIITRNESQAELLARRLRDYMG